MEISKPYEAQLIKLGFSDKEAKVYIASLEIGAAPVQRIAEKSGVKRATTYVMIESLMTRGLMSTYQKGKKTFFLAENPKRLKLMLDAEADGLNKKQIVLDGLLGDLLSFRNSTGEHPGVTFLEGVEGLLTVHQEILSSRVDEILNIVSLDDAERVGMGDQEAEQLRTSLQKGKVSIRVLYTTEKEQGLKPVERKGWERKRISSKQFPLHGEITIFGDKVAAFSYKGKIFATLIDSREIAQTMRVLFNLAWNA